MRKAALLLAVAVLPLAGTHVYFMIWQEYYFPDRYEDAFQALAIAAVMSLVVFGVVGAHYLVSYLHRDDPPQRLDR